MKLSKFEIHSPDSLAGAMDLAHEYGDNGRYLAGGTDLLVLLKLRAVSATHLIDMTTLPGFDDTRSLPGGGMGLGSGMSLDRISHSEEIMKHAPAVCQAAGAVATAQVRNMGTLGGNLCQNTRCRYFNRTQHLAQILPPCIKRGGEVCHVVPKAKKCFAVYQGDMAAALLAHHAILHLEGKEGSRQIPIDELFSGDGRSPLTLDRGELITMAFLPRTPGDGVSGYRKYRLRAGIDFPLAGVAIRIVNASEEFPEGCISVGITGVDSRPLGFTLPGPPDEEALANMINDAVHPVDNVGGTPWHRRTMAK
ncbi:MAG: FAD binding domain-containing protein, partial [Deltaproteobacteria bacterium]|nr:FAD binding domain-containing protein [Deltaproteobacteria bacterium]